MLLKVIFCGMNRFVVMSRLIVLISSSVVC